MLDDLKEYVINSDAFMCEAVQKMTNNIHKGLVVEENGIVIGVFTRNDLVNNMHFFGINTIKMSKVVNKNFTYFKDENDDKSFSKSRHTLIPILDKKGVLIDICFPERRKTVKNYHYPTVIMAGGLGTRLYPYTKILPKPLVPVNGTPMVEIIMNKFNSFGSKKFYLIVNYKKEMIKAYFDGIKNNYEIYYGEEKSQLGTGGGLYYVKELLKESFFLTNCDTLLLENYDEIYEYHKENNNAITIIVSTKILSIPYGVVQVNKSNAIVEMEEKPSYGMLVNTGMYVVDEHVLDILQEEEAIGFPSLIQKMRDLGEKVGVYPITEDKWVDMGQVEELEEAQKRLASGIY